MLSSVSPMNILFVCLMNIFACLILAPLVEQDWAFETVFLTVKGIKSVYLDDVLRIFLKSLFTRTGLRLHMQVINLVKKFFKIYFKRTDSVLEGIGGSTVSR